MVHSRAGTVDVEQAYELIARARGVEQAQLQMWHDGLISGELHSAVGEEAVAAGVVMQLGDGDAMALDHRGTAALVMRGVDPVALLLEAAGSERGLCRGHGGHMHLVAPEVNAVADGIVGSSGPTACGLGLAARRAHPGAVAVAFFGEGATNQGMLLESWNLAVAWQLPVVFVCKDNQWAITTRSRDVTGGRSLVRRARSFGMPAYAVDGSDVLAVASAARRLVSRARAGKGPGFLLARVYRPDGHFAGDPLLRLVQHPVSEGRAIAPGLLSAAAARPGAAFGSRAEATAGLLRRLSTVAWQHSRQSGRRDPLDVARRLVDAAVADEIDMRVEADARRVVADVRSALNATPSPAGGVA